MKNLLTYTTILLIILSIVSCTKKEGTGDIGGQIYGKVTLEEKEDYSNIDIVLRNSDTEEIIREFTTTENGSYEFTDLEEGNYQLEFSSNRDDYENTFIKDLQVVGNRRIPIDETELRIYTIPASHNITEDTVWEKEQSPYYLDSRVTVSEGVTLTIEPGTEMKFDELGELNVQGTLKAIGAEGDSIIFTSSNLNPKIGNWIGIFIITYSQNCYIDYCKIEYADYGVYNDDVFADINNSKILYCGVGIWGDETYNQILKNNLFAQNNTGIYFRSCSHSTIQNNYFSNNLDLSISAGAEHLIEYNNFEGDNGIRLSVTEPKIYRNHFSNKSTSINCIRDSYPAIEFNNFLSGDYFVYSTFYYGPYSHGIGHFQDEEDINAPNNWWGTNNKQIIDSKIWDENDNTGQYGDYTFGYVLYEPFLTSENPEAGIQD